MIYRFKIVKPMDILLPDSTNKLGLANPKEASTKATSMYLYEVTPENQISLRHSTKSVETIYAVKNDIKIETCEPIDMLKHWAEQGCIIQDSIPKVECEHRKLYALQSRNLSYGYYDKEDGGFIGIRLKWGDRYLFKEYHWDNGPPFGTVNPLVDMEEFLPENIILSEYEKEPHKYTINKPLFDLLDILQPVKDYNFKTEEGV